MKEQEDNKVEDGSSPMDSRGRISRLLQCTPLVLCAKRRVKSRFHGRSRARRLNGINIMLVGLATSRTSGRVESIHGIVSPA
jgi:hypothetical protein